MSSPSSEMTRSESPCEIILLDGGLGTTLTSPPYSLTFDHKTPLWSSHLLLTSPSTLLAAQKSFVAAGAEVLLTATYQASFEGFAATGIKDEKKAGRYMRDAIHLASQAFGEREGTVALSLGAYGAAMVPSQEYTSSYDPFHSSVHQLKEWHLNRLQVFLPVPSPLTLSLPVDQHTEVEAEREEKQKCWDNVDLVAFETLPRLDEIVAVREVIWRAYRLLEPEKYRPFWISCVFPGERNRLPDGSDVKEVVNAMLGKREEARRPMGIGINCTRVGKVEGLVGEFEDAVRGMGEDGERVSLVVYPDGTKNGEVYNTMTKEWEVGGLGEGAGSQRAWDEEVFEIVMRARERGVWKSIYVGGCCRTGPEEIGRLRTRIDRLRKDHN